MSFALDVKEEVVLHSFSDEQQKAFLIGFIKYNGELVLTNHNLRLRLTTISNRIARSLLSFIKHIYSGETQISISQSQVLKKSKIFNITLFNDVATFLQNLKIIDGSNQKLSNVEPWILDQTNNFRAYVAGMFVAIGSVNSPMTPNYHLELQFKDENDALLFSEWMKKFRFSFKILKRNENHYVAYVKKSLLVSDFLKFIDASQSVMKFENERISRDMVNNINRISNIDIANQSKTIKTGLEQAEKIKFLKKRNQLQKLSEKGIVLANQRLKNPEYSYAELEVAMKKRGHEITKSGIANLFKNIDKLYEKVLLVEEQRKEKKIFER